MIWKFLGFLWVIPSFHTTLCFSSFLISLPSSHWIPADLASHWGILWRGSEDLYLDWQLPLPCVPESRQAKFIGLYPCPTQIPVSYSYLCIFSISENPKSFLALRCCWWFFPKKNNRLETCLSAVIGIRNFFGGGGEGSVTCQLTYKADKSF